MKKYQINVFTGNKKFAGTDANVYITLYGSKGDTGERQLRSSKTHRDKFERNRVDIFELEAGDLGQISKLRVRRDDRLLGADYYLEKVEVLDAVDGRSTVFVCQEWLSNEDSKGGLLEREFLAEEEGRITRMTSIGRLPSRQGECGVGDWRDRQTGRQTER